MGKAMSSCPSSHSPQAPEALVPARKEDLPSPDGCTGDRQATNSDFDLSAASERPRGGRNPEAYTRKG